MGTSAKTLTRLMQLHAGGLLPSGGSIIELGTQELHCGGMEEYVRDVIRHFVASNPVLKRAEAYSDAEVRELADKGLLGRLLIGCGFSYRALDIFDAENTTLFDLNLHEPSAEMRGKFDLVTNFGTTEHVINQYQSMKTMHELAKPGGLIYHDLPLSGYHVHGYFSYNPLLFRHLADANGYSVVLQHYTRGYPTPAPGFMTSNGYPDAQYFDCGIEFILQKTSDAPFRMPLETSTSLAVNKEMWGAANPYAQGQMNAGSATDFAPSLDQVSGWDLQRELMRRYRKKLARLFKTG